MTFKIKHSKTIEVEPEEAGNLVTQVLTEDFESLCREIKELRGNALPRHKKEDLNHNIELRDAMLVVLGYYMKPSELVEFKEMQRCFGNLYPEDMKR